MKPDTQLFTIDRINAATCLSCTLPDCIYCLDEPAIELRQLCPIWLREHNREQVRLAAQRQRKQIAKFQAVIGDDSIMQYLGGGQE